MHTITIKSEKPMAIIPLEEYEGLKETIGLLAENPNLIRELKEERKKMNKKDCISYENFKKKYKI
ncbi:MAG: hypothetical protein WC614_09545 [bacterium]